MSSILSTIKISATVGVLSTVLLFYASDANAGFVVNRPLYIGLTSGLVGHWSFDGQDVAGVTAYDRSGQGNNGTLTNSPRRVAGRVGQALEFDGSDDYVAVNHSSSLNLGADNTSYAVSVWFKTSTTPTGGNPRIVSKEGTNRPFYINYRTDDRIEFQVVEGANNPAATSPVGTSYTDGAWHQVVGVRDGEANRLFLYVDGVQRANSSDTAGNASDTANLSIGASTDSTLPFDGLIDDVRIYNRALSSDEIKRLYKIGATFKLRARGLSDKITQTLLTNGTDATDASSYTTANFNISANTLVLAAVVNRHGSDATAPTLSGHGATWVQVNTVQFTNASPGRRVTVFRTMLSSASIGQAVTIDFGGTTQTQAQWAISEFSNADTSGTSGSGAVVQSAINNQNSVTSLTVTLSALSSTDNATFGAFSNNDAATDITPDTGFTEIVDTGIEATGFFTEWRNDSDTTVVANDGSNNWGGVALEIKKSTKKLKVNVSRKDTLTDGLVGMWTFDGPDISGTTSTDRSGQGNHGTLTNGPVRGIGRIGQALEFDGSDDYVDAGSAAVLDDLGSITLSAWIYPNTIGENSSDGVIATKATDLFVSNGWQFKSCTGPNFCPTSSVNILSFKVDYDTTNLVRNTGNNVVTLGVWQHVAVTWDGSATAANVKIYVNGSEVSSYLTTTNGITDRVTDAASNLVMGNVTGTNGTFNGLIDDVRVYNRLLSSDEIKRLYSMGR